jgi:hypothetical protein
MGDLSAMAGILILDVLCEVGDLLVELEVGGLQLGDAGHEALDPGLGLGERLRGRGGAPALVRQLRLELSHLTMTIRSRSKKSYLILFINFVRGAATKRWILPRLHHKTVFV